MKDTGEQGMRERGREIRKGKVERKEIDEDKEIEGAE